MLQKRTKQTYQLCDVGHLSHVEQSVLTGLIQHDEAGGHDAEVPERLRVGINVTVAVCWSQCGVLGNKLICTWLSLVTTNYAKIN